MRGIFPFRGTMNAQNSKASVRLFRRPEVEKRVSLNRPTIYALMEQGELPRQRKLTANSMAWVETEVYAWIAERCRVRGNHVSDKRQRNKRQPMLIRWPENGLHRCKPLINMVAGDGIEPPTRGFSIPILPVSCCPAESGVSRGSVANVGVARSVASIAVQSNPVQSRD